MAFLELRNIHKSYFLGQQEFPVLKGIDLDFDLGDFVSILGESGGGKSTLMNIIGGLDRQFTGSLTLAGQQLNHEAEKALNQYRRETIGYIYQSYNLIAHLTVLDNVLVSLDMTKLSKAEKVDRAKQLLEKVGLGEQLKKYPRQLSGGQKQRVAIARALASDPKVIIADEPTGALDAENTTEVLALLNEIAEEGRLVIAVTHSETVAEAGTRIVRMVDGQIDSDERIRPKYDSVDHEMIPSQPLKLQDNLKTAGKHFKYNFWRNSLIILGTAIGLFAVILFSGLGNGISGYINDQITKVANPQSVTVTRYQKSDDDDQNASYAALFGGNLTSPAFTNEQIKQIKNSQHLKEVQPSYSATNVSVLHNGQTAQMDVLTNWTDSQSTDAIKVGRAPSNTGEVVVDRKTVAEKFDKQHWQNLVGQNVTLSYQVMGANQQPVTVNLTAKVVGIGDSASQGAVIAGLNTKTMQEAMQNAGLDTAPKALNVQVDHLDNVKAVTKKLDGLKSNGNRLYKTSSITSLVDQVQTYVNLATTVLAVIAGISLIVSALMIIVTMFMSVSARTKEIGILRALGESKKDIQWLFISESLMTGLLSASFATALAFLAEWGLNAVLKHTADYAFVQISFGNVVTCFVLALLISLLAAVLPARRAAKLNPIDALSAD
ncbi:ATP-binding cassette domain-containing protein [Leuconostocaceae bacterium ESL0958]|nr:ATP-binding cassette domain-containing protein [Leuconostocaceae bacterium ESL0958]